MLFFLAKACYGQQDPPPAQRWCGIETDLPPVSCGALWFLHVPKTGGTSVRDLLKKGGRKEDWTFVPLFRSHYRQFKDHPDAQRFPLTAEPSTRESEASERLNSTHWRQIWRALDAPKPRLLVEQHTGALGLGSHLLGRGIFANISCALRAKGCRLHLVTILREPSARALSLAHYQSVPRSGYSAFIDSNRDGQLHYIWNGEQYHAQNESIPRWSSMKEILSYFTLVGRTEELPAFTDAVCSLLGWKDGKLAHLNAANRSAGDYSLSDKELALTQRLNTGDARLYHHFLSRGPCAVRQIADTCNMPVSSDLPPVQGLSIFVERTKATHIHLMINDVMRIEGRDPNIDDRIFYDNP
jgi:hypothetical protein